MKLQLIGLSVIYSLIAVIGTLLLKPESPIPITLISFSGEYNSGHILIFWETGSELDFAGFYLQRSLEPASNFERLLDPYGNPLFFPAAGEGGAGAQYSFSDMDVIEGTTYYYRLEAIDQGGDAEYSSPIAVSAGLDVKFRSYLPLLRAE